MQSNRDNDNLQAFGEVINNFHLPTWDELPDFDLYMDQVTTLVNRYLEPIIGPTNLLTASMVNNYVKHKIIPAPKKKRYDKEHLAFLIAITLLKQILSLPDIRSALIYQIQLQEKRAAYNSFCQLQEQALKEVAHQVLNPSAVALDFDGTRDDVFLTRSLTLSLALKILTENIIITEEEGVLPHEQ